MIKIKRLTLFLIFILLFPFQNIEEIANISNTNFLILINKENPVSQTYVPDDLVKIPYEYTFRDIYLNKDCLSAYIKLYNEAKMDLLIYSAYRSYAYQQQIYRKDLYHAYPGESEHQSGLAIDVTIHNTGLIPSFSLTKEGKWLKENCHLFGFIIRYPQGKEKITGYPYEPWHIRYVGNKHAKIIYEKGLTLEEYLNVK